MLALLAVATQPIVGGDTVPPGTWPDAVAVIGERGACTGTLVAPDVVITAGHCAELNPTAVIVGTTDYTKGGTRIAVDKAVAHPDWATTYDLAVIVLHEPVAIAPRPIGTACTLAGVSAGTPVHLVGFGVTDAAGRGTSSVLHEAIAPVIDPDCAHGNGCMPAVAPGGELIAGGDGTDSCFGDSGGPVYLDTPRGTFAIAAVSRGVAHADTPCGAGGIYVRTDKLVSWIADTAERDIARDPCDDDAPPPDAGGCSAGSPSIGIALAIIAFVRRADARPKSGRTPDRSRR